MKTKFNICLFVLLFVLFCIFPSGAKAKKKTLLIKSSSSNVKVGGNQQFKAKVKPSGKTFSKVEWSISGISGIDNGIIDKSGVYTAPSSITYSLVITDSKGMTKTAEAKAIDVKVKVKSQKSGIKSARKTITVYTPPAVIGLAINPSKFDIVAGKKKKLSLKVKKKGKGATSDVTWHLFVDGSEVTDGSAGKIKKTGGKIFYKAPSKKKDITVFIVARSEFDPTKISSAKAVVTKKKPKLVISGISPVIDFGTVQIGEDVTGRERTFSITTSTDEGVEWQVSNLPSWLTLEPLRDKTPSTVVLRISSTTSLKPGPNRGTVVFKSQKGGYKKVKLRAFINATEPSA